MNKYNEFVENLKRVGVRLTPQRLLILQTMVGHGGHIGAHDLHHKVMETFPYMDVATVYRTLNLLKRLNFITTIGSGERMYYELTSSTGRHHHMVCSSCDNAFNLSPRYLETFRDALLAQFDFQANLDHFTISGLCVQCQKTNTVT